MSSKSEALEQSPTAISNKPAATDDEDEHFTEEQILEIEKMRAANIAAAKELHATILRVQDTQNKWKDDLEQMIAQEAEEDERARELFKDVMIAEAESMIDPKFMKWMAEREQFGVGREKVDTWYENDQLLLLTPYLAMVPCPRQLTPEGKQFLAETVDDLGLGETFVAEIHRCGVDTPGALYVDREALPRETAPLKTGADLIAHLDATPALQDAVDETRCLFLNDLTSAIRPPTMHFVQGFVVRGRLIAMQLSQETQGSLAPKIAAAAEHFFVTKLAPCLQQRSFIFLAQVEMGIPIDVPPTFLLNIGMLEVRKYGAFAWNDLVGAVVSGGDADGRPVVRIAGGEASVSLANQPKPVAAPAPAKKTTTTTAEMPAKEEPATQRHVDATAPPPAQPAQGGFTATTLAAVAAGSAVFAAGISILAVRSSRK